MQNSNLYMLALTIFGLAVFAVLHSRKSRLCRGHMFSNAVKVMIFISDVQCYVPIKLCKTARSIHLFKITGLLKPENVKLNQNYIWELYVLCVSSKFLFISFYIIFYLILSYSVVLRDNKVIRRQRGCVQGVF